MRNMALILGGGSVKDFPLPYCIPLYHTVSDEHLPHLKHLYDYRNTQQFEKDLDFMARHFNFISYREFAERVSQDKKGAKPAALLTFDDGFSEFKDIIIPILERKGIYAINFINPAFTGQTDLMFRCKASVILDMVINKGFSLKKINEMTGLRLANSGQLKQYLLHISYGNRSVLDRLATGLGIDFREFIRNHRPYMDLDDLKLAETRGFGIGAHSWDHPYYASLGPEQQFETTEKSLQYLKENHIGEEAFAFPFTDYGVKKDFFEQLYSRNPELISFGTAGIKTDSFPRNLQRIPMERTDAASIIKGEIAYYQFKERLGKNKIERG